MEIDRDRYKKIKRDPNLHSEDHMLAKEIAEFCQEPKKFGMFLGVIKRIGPDKARYILGNIKDRITPAREPGKMFMWMARKEPNNDSKSNAGTGISETERHQHAELR